MKLPLRVRIFQGDSAESALAHWHVATAPVSRYPIPSRSCRAVETGRGRRSAPAASSAGSGSGIRTHDLRVMSPTSYRCSIPRCLPQCTARSACASGREARWAGKDGPGIGLFSQRVAPPVSSTLRRFTSVFGMGTGGSTSLETPGPVRCGGEMAATSAAGSRVSKDGDGLIGIDPVGAARRSA